MAIFILGFTLGFIFMNFLTLLILSIVAIEELGGE